MGCGTSKPVPGAGPSAQSSEERREVSLSSRHYQSAPELRQAVRKKKDKSATVQQCHSTSGNLFKGVEDTKAKRKRARGRLAAGPRKIHTSAASETPASPHRNRWGRRSLRKSGQRAAPAEQTPSSHDVYEGRHMRGSCSAKAVPVTRGRSRTRRNRRPTAQTAAGATAGIQDHPRSSRTQPRQPGEYRSSTSHSSPRGASCTRRTTGREAPAGQSFSEQASSAAGSMSSLYLRESSLSVYPCSSETQRLEYTPSPSTTEYHADSPAGRPMTREMLANAITRVLHLEKLRQTAHLLSHTLQDVSSETDHEAKSYQTSDHTMSDKAEAADNLPSTDLSEVDSRIYYESQTTAETSSNPDEDGDECNKKESMDGTTIAKERDGRQGSPSTKPSTSNQDLCCSRFHGVSSPPLHTQTSIPVFVQIYVGVPRDYQHIWEKPGRPFPHCPFSMTHTVPFGERERAVLREIHSPEKGMGNKQGRAPTSQSVPEVTRDPDEGAGKCLASVSQRPWRSGSPDTKARASGEAIDKEKSHGLTEVCGNKEAHAPAVPPETDTQEGRQRGRPRKRPSTKSDPRQKQRKSRPSDEGRSKEYPKKSSAPRGQRSTNNISSLLPAACTNAEIELAEVKAEDENNASLLPDTNFILSGRQDDNVDHTEVLPTTSQAEENRWEPAKKSKGQFPGKEDPSLSTGSRHLQRRWKNTDGRRAGDLSEKKSANVHTQGQQEDICLKDTYEASSQTQEVHVSSSEKKTFAMGDQTHSLTASQSGKIGNEIQRHPSGKEAKRTSDENRLTGPAQKDKKQPAPGDAQTPRLLQSRVGMASALSQVTSGTRQGNERGRNPRDSRQSTADGLRDMGLSCSSPVRAYFMAPEHLWINKFDQCLEARESSLDISHVWIEEVDSRVTNRTSPFQQICSETSAAAQNPVINHRRDMYLYQDPEGPSAESRMQSIQQPQVYYKQQQHSPQHLYQQEQKQQQQQQEEQQKLQLQLKWNNKDTRELLARGWQSQPIPRAQSTFTTEGGAYGNRMGFQAYRDTGVNRPYGTYEEQYLPSSRQQYIRQPCLFPCLRAQHQMASQSLTQNKTLPKADVRTASMHLVGTSLVSPDQRFTCPTYGSKPEEPGDQGAYPQPSTVLYQPAARMYHSPQPQQVAQGPAGNLQLGQRTSQLLQRSGQGGQPVMQFVEGQGAPRSVQVAPAMLQWSPLMPAQVTRCTGNGGASASWWRHPFALPSPGNFNATAEDKPEPEDEGPADY